MKESDKIYELCKDYVFHRLFPIYISELDAYLETYDFKKLEKRLEDGPDIDKGSPLTLSTCDINSMELAKEIAERVTEEIDTITENKYKRGDFIAYSNSTESSSYQIIIDTTSQEWKKMSTLQKSKVISKMIGSSKRGNKDEKRSQKTRSKRD